jgi:hypothetical protein
MDGHDRPVSDILAQELLPRARRGLAAFDADRGEIDHWLGIIDARLERRRTGAGWQRAWVERHGADMRGLVAAYLEHQRGGRPVHTWTLD